MDLTLRDEESAVLRVEYIQCYPSEFIFYQKMYRGTRIYKYMFMNKLTNIPGEVADLTMPAGSILKPNTPS